MTQPTKDAADQPTSAEIEDGIEFTVKLGRALHEYGAPAHRLEDSMRIVSAWLGVDGQFFVTPTAIFASFSRANQSQQTIMNRLEPGEVNLAKLAQLGEVIDDVSERRLVPSEGHRLLDEILQQPPRYGPLLTLVCFVITSAMASRFFGGGWREMATSGLIGLIAGALAIGSGRIKSAPRLLEPASAILGVLVATLAAKFMPPVSIFTATLGGLIVLVPGLTLTTAMTEIASRHLVAGTARLASAGVTFLVLAFGVALGGHLGNYLFGDAVHVDPNSLPEWTLYAALLFAAAGFMVLFQAPARSFGWILLSAILAFTGSRFGARHLGPEMGAFLGALLVGVGSNFYARVRRRPASIPLVPGIILLVPGSLGFTSLSSLIARDIVSGMETAFAMTLIAAALVTGLLMANVILPTRKAL